MFLNIQYFAQAERLGRQNNDFQLLEGICVQQSVRMTGGAGLPPRMRAGTWLLLKLPHSSRENKHLVGAMELPVHLFDQNLEAPAPKESYLKQAPRVLKNLRTRQIHPRI